VFVDGFLTGLWWWRGGRVELELFRALTSNEQTELDEAVAEVVDLLSG
jgi:hypothetical protein